MPELLRQVLAIWRRAALTGRKTPHYYKDPAAAAVTCCSARTTPMEEADEKREGAGAREAHQQPCTTVVDPRIQYLQQLFETYDQSSTADTYTQNFHEACDILFVDAMMNASDFIDQMGRCKESFPDMKFNATNLRLWKEGKAEDDDIFAADYRVTGTHTGKPFAFGPYPEIPAAGVVVELDTERVLFRLRRRENANGHPSGRKNGTCCCWEIIWNKIVPLDRRSGPSSMYEQVGGLVF